MAQEMMINPAGPTCGLGTNFFVSDKNTVNVFTNIIRNLSSAIGNNGVKNCDFELELKNGELSIFGGIRVSGYADMTTSNLLQILNNSLGDGSNGNGDVASVATQTEPPAKVVSPRAPRNRNRSRPAAKSNAKAPAAKQATNKSASLASSAVALATENIRNTTMSIDINGQIVETCDNGVAGEEHENGSLIGGSDSRSNGLSSALDTFIDSTMSAANMGGFDFMQATVDDLPVVTTPPAPPILQHRIPYKTMSRTSATTTSSSTNTESGNNTIATNNNNNNSGGGGAICLQNVPVPVKRMNHADFENHSAGGYGGISDDSNSSSSDSDSDAEENGQGCVSSDNNKCSDAAAAAAVVPSNDYYEACVAVAAILNGSKVGGHDFESIHTSPAVNSVGQGAIDKSSGPVQPAPAKKPAAVSRKRSSVASSSGASAAAGGGGASKKSDASESKIRKPAAKPRTTSAKRGEAVDRADVSVPSSVTASVATLSSPVPSSHGQANDLPVGLGVGGVGSSAGGIVGVVGDGGGGGAAAGGGATTATNKRVSKKNKILAQVNLEQNISKCMGIANIEHENYIHNLITPSATILPITPIDLGRIYNNFDVCEHVFEPIVRQTRSNDEQMSVFYICKLCKYRR